MGTYENPLLEKMRAQGATKEDIENIERINQDVVRAAEANDFEGAILAWLQPLLRQGDENNVDITAAIAERSAEAGGDVVVFARITQRQFAVLRGVSLSAGSYEQALRTIIETFITRPR